MWQRGTELMGHSVLKCELEIMMEIGKIKLCLEIHLKITPININWVCSMKPTLLNWTRETSNFRQNHRQSVTDTKIFSIWSVSFSTDRNSELIQQKENKMVHVGRWIKMKMKNKHSVPFTKVNDHCEETVRKCFHVVSVVQLSNCFLFPVLGVVSESEARSQRRCCIRFVSLSSLCSL